MERLPFKGSGNRACIRVGPERLRFQSDLNQTGKQVGIKNAASAWTLFWDILIASGWTPAPFPSSHRVRVSFGNGEKHSTDGPSLNPAFTDLMMGWPMGWTDPALPLLSDARITCQAMGNGVVALAAARAWTALKEEF